MNYSQAVEASKKQDGYVSIRYTNQSLFLLVVELSDHSILVCEPFDNWKIKQYSIQEFNRLFVNLFDEQCWGVNGSQFHTIMLADTRLKLASYAETMEKSIVYMLGKGNKVFILNF
jgi:hypothetical protein